MIKRQKSIRLLSLAFHQSHHHRHSQSQSRRHSHRGCCYMATSAAASSVVGKNNLLFSGELHVNHHNHKAVPNAIGCISSLGKAWPRVDTGGGGGKGGLLRINGPTLRCCSDDGKGFGNDATKNTNSFQKVWTFTPSLPKLTRDSEIGRFLENEGDSRLADSRGGACHRGSPLGFLNQTLPEKVVVAVDVDEVLGNFVSALNRFIADRYSLNCSVSEYHVYEFFKIWKCSRDEADIRVHEFFKTKYFKTGIHPIPGARQALQKLSRFCNLSVVTSRQNAIKDHTIDWIENHYPGLFQEIHFGNHFALDGQSRPKSDICKSLGAKVLIDDNPRYAIECADVGIRVLLFDYENSYPWCKTESIDQNPLVTKVHNWEEVEQHLLSWIAS